MNRLLFLLLLVLTEQITFGQVLANPNPLSANDFVAMVEKAHNAKAFFKHKAIAYDIELQWGGKTTLQATLTSQTNSGKVKLTFANGTNVFFDGKDFFLSPASVDYKRARFDVLTWQYFFFAPFKLRDKGVTVTPDIDRLNDGRAYPTAKMTFASGTGDSPNDWYILYRNAQTNQLDGLAYIVTFGGKKPDETIPSAITYNNWMTLDGVNFPTKWQFTEWHEAKGFTKIRGEASIRNIRWVDNIKGVFDVPKDSKVVDR